MRNDYLCACDDYNENMRKSQVAYSTTFKKEY